MEARVPRGYDQVMADGSKGEALDCREVEKHRVKLDGMHVPNPGDVGHLVALSCQVARIVAP